MMKRNDWLAETWRYRELFLFLVWRELKVRYKQTALGAAWAVLQPLLLMVVFTFIARKAGFSSGGVPHPFFYITVLIPWTYFSSSLTNAGNSLVANVDLLTKVYFPRSALPASAVLAGLIDFAVGSVFMLCFLLYFRIAPAWEMLLWPLLVLPLVVLSLGAGMFLAALNVNFRDVKYALPFCVQLLLFASPILYDLRGDVPAWVRNLFLLNPLTGTIEAFQACMCPGIAVEWSRLLASVSLSAALFLGGGLYFRKTERSFADLI